MKKVDIQLQFICKSAKINTPVRSDTHCFVIIVKEIYFLYRYILYMYNESSYQMIFSFIYISIRKYHHLIKSFICLSTSWVTKSVPFKFSKDFRKIISLKNESLLTYHLFKVQKYFYILYFSSHFIIVVQIN